ncbi:MAG TPA: right-handed parallel beta-helix repeat-containing protein [Clostridia bacterium]|nr:right-handed parallel beta-helix repeat-containing protein [Clostridia bacterium]
MAILCCLGTTGLTAADYYVRPGGDDAASGTATTTAWRTIERVNRARLQPGDRVLFEAQQTFTGNLLLDSGDAGMPDKPVIIGSFGEGRATIQAGLGYGVLVRNAGGIEVRDLICIGADCKRNCGAGVAFVNTMVGNTRLKYVRIHNVEASGFGRELAKPGTYPEGYQHPQGAGILVAGNADDHSKSGFQDVEITNCTCYDNAYYGILITGYWDNHPTRYANANVHIANCRVYANPGDPLYHENHSGSGILVEDCDGGLVERCIAYDNGALCNDAPGGPSGIWTAVANRVIIQGCESFNNRTGSAPDGVGFDLDGGCTECVLQYNYSHDNDGAGFLVFTYAGAPHTDRGNIVRFNISENDARKLGDYGGIWVRNAGKGMTGLRIYNNTIIAGSWARHAIGVLGEGVEGKFWNNLLVSSGKAVPLWVEKPQDKLRFENNLYWREEGSFKIVWDDKTYESLERWRNDTGQETRDGKVLGVFADPLLTGHSATVQPRQIVGISKLQAFRPRAGSPTRNAGLNLSTQDRPQNGFRNFFDAPLPKDGAWPLGAVSTAKTAGSPSSQGGFAQ